MKFLTPAIVAGSLLFASSAIAATGEYDNMCAMGLALGDKVETDCSISAEIGGKTYCFGNETAKTLFMKDTEGNLKKAQSFYMMGSHYSLHRLPQGRRFFELQGTFQVSNGHIAVHLAQCYDSQPAHGFALMLPIYVHHINYSLLYIHLVPVPDNHTHGCRFETFVI